jgi:phage host-nuclease inhibitor protein Gam
MAVIQVHTMKTRILDYFWDEKNLDNESDSYCKTKLEEFTLELTKTLETNNRTSQIKWEVSDDSDSFIHDFATEQNIKNGYK